MFHETPYMKLFVAKHCSKYTMIGPLFRTDGKAFVRSLLSSYYQIIFLNYEALTDIYSFSISHI